MKKEIYLSFFNKDFNIKINNYIFWFIDGIVNEETSSVIEKKFSKINLNKLIKNNIIKQLIKSGDSFYGKTISDFPKRVQSGDFQFSIENRILMFKGLAVECFLKSYIIKNKKIPNILNGKNEINRLITSHNLSELFKTSFGQNKEFIKNQNFFQLLERAIKAGKYSIEKKKYDKEYNENYISLFNKSNRLIIYIKNKI